MKTSTLSCSHNTAGLIFIALGTILTLTGCAQIYGLLGLDDEQTSEQVAQDQEAIQYVLGQARTTTTEIITTTLAGIGAVLSGLLTKWLNTERKITSSMIKAIESSEPGSIKEAVKTAATAAGVETQLHARVAALT